VRQNSGMTDLRLPLVALTLAAAAADAWCASGGRPAASQPVGRLYATRAQLRECLDLEDALKARRKSLDAGIEAHETQLAAISADDQKLVEVQAHLDRESETAVNAFNLLVTDHNVRAKELRNEAETLRAATEAYNDESLAVNRKCSALTYSLDDMNAVMKERRAAGK